MTRALGRPGSARLLGSRLCGSDGAGAAGTWLSVRRYRYLELERVLV